MKKKALNILKTSNLKNNETIIFVKNWFAPLSILSTDPRLKAFEKSSDIYPQDSK